MNQKQNKVAANGNILYIAVHNTNTAPLKQIRDLDNLPYHYLITRSGKLLNLRPVSKESTVIDVAWVGGMDKQGNHVDNRMEVQSDTLFNTLVWLTVRFPNAKISPADKLSVYDYPNPGFDITAWLNEYVPSFLAV
jgi:hypothetical protein